MARTSTQDIKILLTRLNRVFAEANLEIVLEGRYGYSAIELYELGGKYPNLLKTLRTGMTKKEVMIFLDGLDIGAGLVEQFLN